MAYRKKIVFISVVIFSCVLLWKLSDILPERVWGIVEAIGTFVGVILVLIELKEAKDVSEGSFVSSLSENFNGNEGIQRIYRKLELKEPITEEDTIDIVAYLTYFETIYVLLKKKAIDISLIDDLFAYRFRLALNNNDIRRISLLRHDYAYVNIYRLEDKWRKYKNVPSILETFNPNTRIVKRGNVMKKEDLKFRLANIEDSKEIHGLMNEVFEGLSDKSLYVCDELEYVENMLSGGGFGVVVCNKDGKIIASFIFRYPMDSDDNLGRDIDLAEEELTKVVHMESAVVHPNYRGKDLQLKMLKYAETLIDQRKYKYFIATVSPENPASYRSFEKNGYRFVLTKEKYDGLTRRIYLKETFSLY